jgi:hypothetical protein
MGRKSKLDNNKKIKFGISLDRDLFSRMVVEKIKKSTLMMNGIYNCRLFPRE